jgi:hypothetical protein
MIERLLDKIKRPEFDGADRHFDVAMAGDQNQWHYASAFAQLTLEIETGHVRHPNVRDRCDRRHVSRFGGKRCD